MQFLKNPSFFSRYIKVMLPLIRPRRPGLKKLLQVSGQECIQNYKNERVAERWILCQKQEQVHKQLNGKV
jgi:hypothetical protein